MAGFFSYAFAGVGFLLISAAESLSASLPRSLPFLAASTLSLLAAGNSLLSSAFSSAGDPIGAALPLSSLPVAALFLLHSLSSLNNSLPIPPPLLHLLSLAAFAQEFLLFRLRNGKDSAGLENRYFDLLLVPILICAAASVAAIARPQSPFPRLARAAGLALQGSWLLQMAFSLFTSCVAHGCALRRRSRANFTVACVGHEDAHRAGAIATLQFNLHLAGLVIASVVLCAINGAGRRQATAEYRPVGKQLQRLEHVSALDSKLESDEDEEMSMTKNHGMNYEESASEIQFTP